MEVAALQDQALIEIGRIVVSEAMWHALRIEALPWAAEKRPSGLKPDLLDVPKPIDMVANEAVNRVLNAAARVTDLPLAGGCLVVSEEHGLHPTLSPQGGVDEDLLVFVDPVDYTAAAARGLDGSVLISFWDVKSGRIRAAVVGDLYRRRLYWRRRGAPSKSMRLIFPEEPTTIFASKDEKLGPPSGIPLDLAASKTRSLSGASINIFVGSPDRLMKACEQGRALWASPTNLKKTLPKGIKEIFSVGGSLGPLRVAEGTWDASIEIAKGFRIWDFAPGAFIAAGAGAAVVDLQGKEIQFSFKVEEFRHWLRGRFTKEVLDAARQKFVVAATPELARDIVGILKADKKL